MSRWTVSGLALVLLLSGVLAVGCTSSHVRFASDEAAYSIEDIDELHTSVERPAALDGAPVADASSLRRNALVAFRRAGGEAADFAQFVTESLADSGRSVPYYGEAAEFDGRPVWILLELWGPEGGTLSSTRLWVFERDGGDVAYASAHR